MKIAPMQRGQLDFLRDTLVALDRTTDRDSRRGFREIRERLDQWAAKVAVIGQVKAGKSTFLNAFLHQHDFLPSDINPWTSVVTNIRINMPGDPPSGARFDFFDEADWDEIITGTSRIRKLTEQLLPGFDTELLRKQSEEMRARAERRLGNNYHALLGKEHSYDFLTPDLLKRYVCAGPGSDQGLEREALGRYAAITKVANAYMRLPEFQVPTIITDTPGVNDPFLVRDEFTCRSLDKSDIFVVVLSAHQALTDVDIALIRILAQQDEKDVMIFVNRIDELDDYSSQVSDVIGDVAQRLGAAIPDIEFTVLAGSAYLADLALRDDEDAQADRDRADNEDLKAYLKTAYGRVPEDQIDRLLLASGMDAVKQTLSMVIDNGIGCHHLNQMAEDIRAEINGVQFVTKRARDSLQAQVEKVGGDNARAAVQELEAEIDAIRQVQDGLDAQVEQADSGIETVVTKAWSGLEEKLLSEIDAFVDGQRETFERSLLQDSPDGGDTASIQIDLTPLQLRLDEVVQSSFAASRAGMDDILEACIQACRQTVKDRFDDPTGNISLDQLPYDSFSTTLTLSKRSLYLNAITDRGWAFWRKKSLNVEKTMTALRAIAGAELRAPVEKLMAAFNEAQVDRASAGTSRIRVLQRMIETSLTERTQRLKRDKAELERVSEDPEARDRLSHRLQSQLEVLETRLLNLSATDSSLTAASFQAAA